MAAEVGGGVEAKVAGAAMAARTAEWVEAAQAAEVLEAAGWVWAEWVEEVGMVEPAPPEVEVAPLGGAVVGAVESEAPVAEAAAGALRACRSRRHRNSWVSAACT